jgi:hypothetical protein
MVLGAALPAAAQTEPPTFELSAGYQFTHVPDQDMPLGFAIDAARNWGNFGLVAEGGWAYDSDSEAGIDFNFNLWHLGAGPRWSGRTNPTVTPYGQVIVGWIQGRASTEIAGIDISDSTNHFMVQPGGGVSVQAGDGWAIFGAVDYRRVFIGDDDEEVEPFDDDDSSGENQFRIFVGVRMLLD